MTMADATMTEAAVERLAALLPALVRARMDRGELWDYRVVAPCSLDAASVVTVAAARMGSRVARAAVVA